jgi:broad specificity phosphatase PhoE
MADELPDDQNQDNGPGTGPTLPPERLKELGGILVKMKSQGTSADKIKTFVSGYTKLYGSAAAPPSQPGATGKPSQAEENPMVQLQKAAGDAKDHLDQESAGNDDAIQRLIYQGRAARAQGAFQVPTSDATRMVMPGQPAPTPDPPISPEEMAATRDAVNTNEISRRAHLQAVTHLHPEKAAAIQQAQYLVDRQQEVEQDPQGDVRAQKVLANAKRMDTGELQYALHSGQVLKPEGFVEGLLSSNHAKNELFDDYQKFTASDQQSIDKLEKERKDFDPERPVASPQGIAGTFGSMLGSTPIKSMVGGAITTAAGAPEAAPFVAALLGSSDYYQMSYASTLRNSYNEFRDQGLDPTTALGKAKSEAMKEGLTDAASGAVMSALSAKIGLKEGGAPMSFSEGYKGAALALLNKSKNFAATQGVEGGIVGLTQGLAQYAKNKEAQASGLKRDDWQDVGDQAVKGALFTVGLAAVTKLGGEIPARAKAQFLQGLSRAPEEEVNAKLGEMIASKQITPEDAVAAKKSIADQRAIDQTIPDNITDESRMKIQGRIARRTELEQQLKDQDPAYHPEIKEKIKAVNEQILELSQDKIKRNAVQEQEPASDDVRDASGDRQTVGGRDEKEGAVPQDPSQQGPETPDHVLEARHANTEHDEQGIASGQNQLGLSDDGVLAAHQLKEEVQDNHKITKIITSNLQRGKETGDIVSDRKIPVEHREGLNSMDLKDFNGMKDTELKPIMHWFGDHPDATKYEGPAEAHQGKELGESINDYAHRAIAARSAVEKEGPGTMVISHSNNINIWEAYKANGNKWDANAVKDYLSRETPEPATIVRTPEEHAAESHIADNVEANDEPTINRAKLFIADEAQQRLSPEQVHGLDEATPGSNGSDEAPRQLSKGPSAPKLVSQNGQGAAPPNQNSGGQPVPPTPSAPDPARLTMASKQLLLAGRTDEQVMNYLNRKGLDPHSALAVLGEAKANPISTDVREASIDQAADRYYKKEDAWLGNKELNKVQSQQLARIYQDDIRASVKADPKQKGVNWKDVDKAIHIYLDTQRNPGHMQEFYNDLSPEQQRIADLSQKLNPEQLKIADRIKAGYEQVGEFAKDNGI